MNMTERLIQYEEEIDFLLITVRSEDYNNFYWIFGFLLMIIFVIFVWNRRLQQYNSKLDEQQRELERISKISSDNENFYRSILLASPDAIISTNKEGKIRLVSPKALELVGLDTESQLIGRRISEFIHEDDRERMKMNAMKTFSGVKNGPNRYIGYKFNGEQYIMEVNSEFIDNEDQDLQQMVSLIRDITERVRTEESLQRSEERFRQLSKELAHKNKMLSNTIVHDQLTGIHNRYYFEQRIHEELAASDRYGNPLSMALVDLDFFKNVNDEFGHAVGDEVLVRIASIIQEMVRKSDVFARWGGEEFVILMPNTNSNGAKQAAQKICDAVAEGEFINNIKITISLGVAQRNPREYLDSWFRRCDRALYFAKQNGRNQVGISEVQKLETDFTFFQWQKNWASGN